MVRNRTIALPDELWEALKKAKDKSGKPWKEFLKPLIKNKK